MAYTFSATIVDTKKLQDHKQQWISSVMMDESVRIFAYGSLMWKPNCAVINSQSAILQNYHRDFCLYSYMYRGSLKNLGLVLGLKSGGKCAGMVMKLCPSRVEDALNKIWNREMITGAYVPIATQVQNDKGKSINCHTFIAKTDHNQWAGDLPVVEQAKLIHNAVGEFGDNKDYLYSTYEHLLNMNIDDLYLKVLVQSVKKIESENF